MRKKRKASELLNSFKPVPQILENVSVKNKDVINKNKCKNLQEIQSFNLGGYSYSEEHTIDSNSPVFIR